MVQQIIKKTEMKYTSVITKKKEDGKIGIKILSTIQQALAIDKMQLTNKSVLYLNELMKLTSRWI
jgi:hypothetical protein